MPCDKTAVAMRLDPTEGSPSPVCAYHSRADMVPLADVIAARVSAALNEAADAIEAVSSEPIDGPFLSRARAARIVRARAAPP